MADRVAQHPAQIVDMVGADLGFLLLGIAGAAREESMEAVQEFARSPDEIAETGVYVGQVRTLVTN